MESITKNRQSPAVLRAMAERAFGPAQLPSGGAGWFTELGHGWFNVVYRIDLLDGRRTILKIAPPAHVEVMSYERGAMATELAALRLIREHTSVPVPEILFGDRSHELCDADYFFMSHVEGEPLGLLYERGEVSPDDQIRFGEALGAVNRELNRIPGPWFGALEGPGEPTWRGCFTGKLEEVLGDGERRGVDLTVGYDVVRAAIADRAAALEEVTEPRFVEWELFPNNAMVHEGRIVGVIDHERAFYGDPLIEAGFVALDLPAFGDPGPFLRGYGRGELTTGEHRRRWLYTLYLALVMVIETEFRALGAEQYEKCGERLRELLDAGD
ncbi:aminoglycoside phosphotransferase [Kineosporia sp. NBRC 101677]|uniref:phosphotransferase family protein n=1 Tax=Kineosporia sp. NBRC 101677 TaxID=3032197 RepID=UPI0024A2D1BD|nr:aminoglycoside phosphotransferase family protein [Kineosporia sp. NBRC 101677]GLY15195.1 aminoglycoside phosphotransferase [Kineosporia sp. NBRC 101677]